MKDYNKQSMRRILQLLLILIMISACSSTSQQENTEKEPEIFPLPQMIEYRPEEDKNNLLPNYSYTLNDVHEVDGRQGIAWEAGLYYVSGSATLSIYDEDWNQIAINDKPFEGYSDEVNHIGDIDVYDGQIYAGVEYFMDGEAKNIQIAIYDAETLKMERAFPFATESGQNEVSGIAVDPDDEIVFMCSWADGESGRYLYMYDMNDGSYLGKVHLQAPPQWIQGIAYLDGYIYITADDGTADDGEADHVYRIKVDPDTPYATVVLERTLDDVILPGEIEGISFDSDQQKMLISYNRGARIVLGMPRGFYEGYDKEIHEVYIYDMEVSKNQ